MRIGLRAKYSLQLAATVIVAAGLVSLGVMSQFQRGARSITASVNEAMETQLLAQLAEEGELFIRILADNLTKPVYFGDMETINQLVNAVRAVEDTAYVYLHDPQRKVVTDGTTDNPFVDRVFADPISQRALGGREIVVQAPGHLIDIASPVVLEDQLLGWVRIGLSTERVHRETHAAQEQIQGIIAYHKTHILSLSLFLSGAVILLGVLLSFLVAGGLARPITRLGEAAAKVGRGDLTPRLPVTSTDELGQLAASFNTMTEGLERTTVSKAYVENIIRSMTDTLVVFDASGIIRTVNQATCAALGYREDELVGQPVGLILADEDAAGAGPTGDPPLVTRSWLQQRLLEKGNVQNVEMTYQSKDGRKLPMLFSGSVMQDQRSGRAEVVGIAKNITELKQMQEHLKETAKELARSNQDLTGLTQDMEELLRVVSHDLRAPLINIQGFSKRLEPIIQETVQGLAEIAAAPQAPGAAATLTALQTRLQTRAGESLAFIGKGIEKMDALLSSLLTISRIGRRAEPWHAVDLNAVLDEVLATFAHQLEEAGITVVRHPLPGPVRGRRQELNQVVANLLANAIKYMGPGPERRIEFGGILYAEAVECYVRDTGIGIAPADHDRIFQLFTRLETLPVPGEGIGLAYVKKVVQSHGGRIWVESQPLQGSAFRFRLPKA